MKICLLWRRYGPHHLARLRASTEVCGQHGAEVIGIELANQGGEHQWQGADQATRHLITMFPDQRLESLSPRTVFHRTRALLDRIDPDVVAVPAYSKPESQSALLWARDRKCIAIVMTDSRREDVGRSPVRERVKHMIVSQFDAALAGGSPQARYIENLGLSRDRIFTPYNAVDNHFFAMRAARAREDPRRYHHLPGLESPAPFFLASGRFIARKNFSRLLEAFGAYVRSRPGDNAWRLIILGDGPERQHLLDTARHGPGSEFVTFAGYQQANEVAVYYGLAGAFIHPALADQWGLVVNEAMAAGLPVLVSTGAGAAEDLVRHGVNGLTFDPYSIDAMADAMCQMSRSGADLARMGHKSSELIDGWSPRRFAEGLWQAVCAGASTQDRAMPLIVRAIICASPAVPQALLRWRSVEE